MKEKRTYNIKGRPLGRANKTQGWKGKGKNGLKNITQEGGVENLAHKNRGQRMAPNEKRQKKTPINKTRHKEEPQDRQVRQRKVCGQVKGDVEGGLKTGQKKTTMKR